MNLYLYVNDNDKLVMYMVDASGKTESCKSLEEFNEVVGYLDRAGYTIIKKGQDVILKNDTKNFSLEITDVDRVFKKRATAELRDSFDYYYGRYGAIDKTNVRNISSKKTHNSKHVSNKLKAIACLAVLGGVIVGGILIGYTHKSNNELTPSQYYTEVAQPEAPMLIQDIGDEAFNQEENISIEYADSTYVEDTGNFAELNFENNSDTEKAIKCKNNYYNLICEIAPKYGLDPDMMLAVATQERGEHSSVIDDGGGIGLMQIQYNVWVNQEMYYDIIGDDGEFHTKRIVVTDEMMRDLRTNIELACGAMQNCLDACANNPAMAIYMYNHGYGAFHELFVAFCEENNLDRGDTCRDFSNLDWYTYMKDRIDSGDPVYLQKVLQWSDEPTFEVLDRETGEITNYSFVRNENVRK